MSSAGSASAGRKRVLIGAMRVARISKASRIASSSSSVAQLALPHRGPLQYCLVFESQCDRHRKGQTAGKRMLDDTKRSSGSGPKRRDQDVRVQNIHDVIYDVILEIASKSTSI
jgi:hypothetical protein